MCRVLEFAERTFYAAKARPPAARTVTDEAHKTVITARVEGQLFLLRVAPDAQTSPPSRASDRALHDRPADGRSSGPVVTHRRGRVPDAMASPVRRIDHDGPM